MATPDPRDRAEGRITLDAFGRVTHDAYGDSPHTLGGHSHDDITLGAEGVPMPESGAPLEPGTQVGRYVVEQQLGAGGMGVVYAAHDPQLDRKVAVKLVHAGVSQTHSGGGRNSAGSSRLLREAQAMAKLHHPNVIVVHDVGTFGEQVFIAMEYLDGGTLRRYTELDKPAVDELLARYLLAGAGLAAAHAAGIVHRDFKPENVLLGSDGRVCVVDFGLARGVGMAAPTAPPTSDTTTGNFGLRLTQTGAVMGTPAYMSPEQHEGLPADERSDQFSFCVALYEAVYGQRPFEGDTLTTLVVNVVEGKLRPPPPGHRAPAYLFAVLARGLKVDPNDRWPNIDALLAALREDPAHARRRRLPWVGAGVLALVGAAGTYGYVQSNAATAPTPCVGAQAQIAEVYDAQDEAAIATALGNVDPEVARDVWPGAAARLHAYADEWATMHTEACEATRVAGEQSAEMLDRRMACLSQRRASLDNVVGLLRAPDHAVVDKLDALVDGLDPIAPCGDLSQLMAVDVLPEGERDAILAAYAKVDRVRQLRTLVRYDEAQKVLDELTREAEGLTYARLQASIQYMRAALLADRGDPKDAEAALYDAAIFASKVGEDGLAATAWIALVRLVGIQMGRASEIGPTLKAAEAAVARLPEDDDHHRGSLLSTAGTISILNEDNATAETQLREAVQRLTRASGPEHDNVLESREMLGVALQGQGKLDEARTHLQAVLDIRERTLGPDHPLLASLIGNLGLILSDQGKHAEAEAAYARCLTLLRKGFGDKHQVVVTARLNLSNAQRRQGKLDDADENLGAAISLAEELFADSARMAGLLLSRARLRLEQKRPEEALADAERGEAMYTKAYDAKYPRVSDALLSQARALLDLGRLDEAEAKAVHADELRMGDPDAAAGYRAESKFEIARVRYAKGTDRAAARTLATEARAMLGESPDPADLAEIDAWLEDHP